MKKVNGGNEQIPKQKKIVKKKATYLTGFDKVALNMKNKAIVLARRKGISSFTLIAEKQQEGKEPIYSGGMVGDAATLVQGLYFMAQQREDVRAMLEIVTDALKANDLQGLSLLDDLEKEGKLSAMCVNALKDEKITDLKQLKRKTKEEVRAIKNIGEKAFKGIESLMLERSWDFKTK